MDIRQIPVRKNQKEARKEKEQCVRRIHVLSNILQDEMFEPPDACERASREEIEKMGGKRVTKTVSIGHMPLAGVSFRP